MASGKSPELHRQLSAQLVPSEAEEWGRQFIKVLEVEYADASGSMPAKGLHPDWRRTMMTAIVAVFRESGLSPAEIVRLFEQTVGPFVAANAAAAWTGEKNARRFGLIDKQIQQTITWEESLELIRLTDEMRACCENESTVPLEGARELHRQLIENRSSQRTPS